MGCNSCKSCTGHYQPQNHIDDLDLNPEPKKMGKAMKEMPVVRRAFRAFLSEVLGEPDLLEPERCRHMHQDPVPLPLEDIVAV
jgi:hypothetical protein